MLAIVTMPIATTTLPRLGLGEVAFLSVSACTRFGAFVDWGLPKELLVPFAEQTTDMRVGEKYAVGLYIDPSWRLAGTMRISEMPKVECIIMPSGGFWGGVGEPTIFVAAPAVLNAIFAATCKRILSFPLKNQNITLA